MTRTLVLCMLVGCRLGFDDVSVASDALLSDTTPADAAITTITFGERATSQRTNVTADTTLAEAKPDVNSGAEGSLSTAAGAGFADHALVRFELSSLPIGTRVRAARLRLVRVDFGDEVTGELTLVPVADAWVEGDNTMGATWLARSPGMAWSQPGGAFGATSQQFMPADPIEVPIEVSVVQGWIDAPASNAGFAIVPRDPLGGVHYHFSSREEPQADRRPELVLEVEL